MSFKDILTNLSSDKPRLFSQTIERSDYIPIDLSTTNRELQKAQVFNSPELFEQYINKYLSKTNGTVAFGGYLEKRDLYAKNLRFASESQESPRNIHLGMDFWSGSGSLIYAPLPGVIHSFANNSDSGNYGPTIILKHTLRDSVFYTLYGHLSLISLQHCEVGIKIEKGTTFASLGDNTINGGYAPHLHFQIIRDIETWFGDYPGVCSKKNLDSFKENCPDPNWLLGM